MVLQTNLKHLRSKIKLRKLLKENKDVIIIAGRDICSNCNVVINIFENIDHITKILDNSKKLNIFDWDYDLESADIIRDLPECEFFESLPFVIYFKNGKVINATSGRQTYKQIKEIILINYDILIKKLN